MTRNRYILFWYNRVERSRNGGSSLDEAIGAAKRILRALRKVPGTYGEVTIRSSRGSRIVRYCMDDNEKLTCYNPRKR